jgi:hypothetical protein
VCIYIFVNERTPVQIALLLSLSPLCLFIYRHSIGKKRYLPTQINKITFPYSLRSLSMHFIKNQFLPKIIAAADGRCGVCVCNRVSVRREVCFSYICAAAASTYTDTRKEKKVSCLPLCAFQ